MRTDFVVATCVFHEDKILLIHHKKSGLWLYPGGHIDENELPDDAAVRELLEETGLKGRLLSIPDVPVNGDTQRVLANPFHVNVHTAKDKEGLHHHCCFYYLCTVIGKVNVKINKDEIYDYKWLRFEDLDSSNLADDVRTITKLAFGVMKLS